MVLEWTFYLSDFYKKVTTTIRKENAIETYFK